jgi:hypothetical protein
VGGFAVVLGERGHRLDARGPKYFEPGVSNIGQRVAHGCILPIDYANQAAVQPDCVSRPEVAMQKDFWIGWPTTPMADHGADGLLVQ